MGSEVSKSDKEIMKEERRRFIETLTEEESGDTSLQKTPKRQRFSHIDPKDYSYPFENLVFEGGGAKGGSYWGAIKYLEELGVMGQVKRVAGTSIGSMAAVCCAVGLQAEEIVKYLDEDFQDLLFDGGFFEILPNLLSSFGWHRGERFNTWFGEILRKQTGSADITFAEVLKQYGRELCIVVTNVNLMSTEYFHPKTTPDMPIRLAMRMSISLPGLFEAKKYPLYGTNDVFVDGGIICNYPIHCFDGWFLSMKDENSFFRRLHGMQSATKELGDRFYEEALNTRTLGFLVFSDKEGEVMRSDIDEEVEPLKPDRDTAIYTKWLKKRRKQLRVEMVKAKMLHSARVFMQILQKHNLDNDNFIDREELENALKDEVFTANDAKLLFGKEMNPKLFDILDTNGDGKIHYSELMAFMGESGICLHNHLLGCKRINVKNFSTYVFGMVDTIVLNTSMINFKPRDINRSVGINTGYIETADFSLEKEDKEFLIERGYNSCKSFLQRYVVTNKLEKKGDTSLD